MKKSLVYIILALHTLVSYAQTPVTINPKSSTRHGPENGSLLIIGGNVGSTTAIWEKFTALAGGKDKAHIVVITAAGGDAAFYDEKAVNEVKKQTGIKDVVLMHPKNLAQANDQQFLSPLKKATGVYFIGGRQWRIADAYLNTAAHQAFLEILNRGGVIAGSSAGASIQGSFLWRGDTKGADILVGDHTQGLGFLKNSAIDQHLLKRNRQFDLVDFIKAAPQLIGIGLDEATAIVVEKDTLEVLGKSYVVIYDAQTSQRPLLFLADGQQYDLKNRKIIPPAKKNGRIPLQQINLP